MNYESQKLLSVCRIYLCGYRHGTTHRFYKKLVKSFIFMVFFESYLADVQFNDDLNRGVPQFQL